jgi:hypothetical protein
MCFGLFERARCCRDALPAWEQQEVIIRAIHYQYDFATASDIIAS